MKKGYKEITITSNIMKLNNISDQEKANNHMRDQGILKRLFNYFCSFLMERKIMSVKIDNKWIKLIGMPKVKIINNKVFLICYHIFSNAPIFKVNMDKQTFTYPYILDTKYNYLFRKQFKIGNESKLISSDFSSAGWNCSYIKFGLRNTFENIIECFNNNSCSTCEGQQINEGINILPVETEKLKLNKLADDSEAFQEINKQRQREIQKKEQENIKKEKNTIVQKNIIHSDRRNNILSNNKKKMLSIQSLIRNFKQGETGKIARMTAPSLNRIIKDRHIKGLSRARVSEKREAIKASFLRAPELRKRARAAGINIKKRQNFKPKQNVATILNKEKKKLIIENKNKKRVAVNYDVRILIKFSASGNIREREEIINVRKFLTDDEIRELAENKLLEYFNDMAFGHLETLDDIRNISYFHVHFIKIWKGTRKLKGVLGGMKLDHVLFNKLNFNIKSNHEEINNNCVDHYMVKKYEKEKGCIKFIKQLKKQTNEWTVEKLCNILKEHKKPFKCYTQNLKIYDSFDDRSKRIPIFNFIVSNEHIYPVDRKELSALYEVKNDKFVIDEIKYIEKIDEFVTDNITKTPVKKFKLEIMDDGDSNKDVTIYEEAPIYGFKRVLMDKVLYIKDEGVKQQYEFIMRFCEFMPIGFNFKPQDPLFFLCNKHNLISSYTENLNINGAIFYNDSAIKGDLKAIDKNGCYSYAFSQLEYLPVFNSNTPAKTYEDGEIIETNFYYVNKVIKNFYNTLSVGWCSGYRLIGSEKLVKIKAVKTPTLVKNPFRDIINKMIEKNPAMAKTIINIFVGMMSMNTNKYSLYYKGLTNSEDEANTLFDNPVVLYNGMYTDEIYNEAKSKYRKNMVPITIMIHDYAIFNLKNKINELQKIDPYMKIRKICTDSITYISDKIDLNKLNLDKNLFSGWKQEPIKWDKLIKHDFKKPKNNSIKLKDIKIKKFEQIKNWSKLLQNKSILFDCYAGTGKTHVSLNRVLPVLERNLQTFVIIACKHSALVKYYEKEKNAKVIHYFKFNQSKTKELQSYDYIIIDECGLISQSEFEYIYNNIGSKTKLIFLGDKDQLLPIGRNRDLLSQLCYNEVQNLFDVKISMTRNYRNHYTTKNYDDMKQLKFKITKYEKKLFNRYGKLNLAITRNKMNEINQHFIKGWTDEFADKKVKKGGRLVAEFRVDNKDSESKGSINYKEFRDMKLYNGSFLTIIDYDDEIITLEDVEGKQFKINKKLFGPNFNYGYCITTFRAQGLSIPYEDLGIWEFERIKNDGRQLYTTLSRLQNIVNDIKDTWDVNNEELWEIEEDEQDYVDPLDIIR